MKPLDLSTLNNLRPEQIVDAFRKVLNHSNELAAQNTRLQQQIDSIHVPTFAEISAALSAGGSDPLNLTGLVGETVEDVAIASTIPAGPGAPPPAPPPPADGGFTWEFSKRTGAGRWPDLTPPGWRGPMQYTAWVFYFVGGAWFGSAFIQYWFAEPSLESGGPPSAVAGNWTFGSAWGVISNYQPILGETVGYMLSSGNQRQSANDLGNDPVTGLPVQERTNIVTIPFPSDANTVFTFSGMTDAIPPGSITIINAIPLATMTLTAELTQLTTRGGASPPP